MCVRRAVSRTEQRRCAMSGSSAREGVRARAKSPTRSNAIRERSDVSSHPACLSLFISPSTFCRCIRQKKVKVHAVIRRAGDKRVSVAWQQPCDARQERRAEQVMRRLIPFCFCLRREMHAQYVILCKPWRYHVVCYVAFCLLQHVLPQRKRVP